MRDEPFGGLWLLQQMRALWRRGRFPQSVLVSGPPGAGKGMIARYVAQALLCTAAVDERPCGRCAACRRVEGERHLDLLVLRPEPGRPFRIDQIREAERFLRLTPREGAKKVVIIEDFHLATVAAENALLKTLEEPPPYAHLLLTADEAAHLLPTILSRVRLFPMRLLPPRQVADALKAKGVGDALAAEIAALSAGRLGWAMHAAEEPAVLDEARQLADSLFRFLEATLPERFALAQSWSQREQLPLLPTRLEYWRLLWRDLLAMQASPQRSEADACGPCKKLAALVPRLPPRKTLQLARLLGDALDALRQNVNPRLLLEVLALELPTLLPPSASQ